MVRRETEASLAFRKRDQQISCSAHYPNVLPDYLIGNGHWLTAYPNALETEGPFDETIMLSLAEPGTDSFDLTARHDYRAVLRIYRQLGLVSRGPVARLT